MSNGPDHSLKALVDFSPLAIISHTPEGKISVWNPAAERLLGWSAHEVLGQQDPTIPPETRPDYEHDLHHLLRGCSISGKELALLHRDGRRIEVRLWASPTQSANGEISGITAFLQDIGAQKESARTLEASKAQQSLMQLQLQQNAERMSLAFRAGKIGFWDWNIITGEQVWSTTSRRQLGLPDDAPATFDVLMSAIYPADRQLMQDAIHSAIQDRKDYLLEYRSRWPDGSIHWHFDQGRAFYDETGRPVRMTGVTIDIDERKTAQQDAGLRAAALQAAANAIVITNPKGTILWVNHAFSKLTGYPPEEALGRNPRLLKSGEQDIALYRELWQTITSGSTWHGEIVNRRKDRSLYTEEMTITPVRSPANEITHFIAIKQDVTARKQTEQALQQAEAKYRAMFEDALVGMFQISKQGHPPQVNRAFAQLHGYDSPEQLLAEVPNLTTEFLVDSPGSSRWEEFERTLNESGVVRGAEIQVYRKDRSKKWVVLNLRSVRTPDGQVAYHEGTVEDITDRKAAEERVQFLAYYDALTGLPNRTLLKDRLSQSLARARRERKKLAVLYFDLDRFKNINDSLGHSVGDLVLQSVADRLRGWAREQDTVCRLAGDEFVIVVNGVAETGDAALATDRLMKAMATEFIIQGNSLRLGCSVGISLFPDHGSDPETLMKNADAAMYCAKENGRNQFALFTTEMNAAVVERLTLENSMRAALSKNQFFLAYQPQMEIATGNLIGLEALLRWQHPDMGLVPPDKFIRIAENSGLIVPLGEWALRSACAQARAWQNQGLLSVPVSVNVSAIQFRQEGFCRLVKMVLEETSLPPDLLELELTESLLLSHADRVLSELRDLKNLGIKLSIDDFGTGYSSLSYLRQFPVNKLKIDRSFVRNITGNSDDAAIAVAIIGMAKNLNLRVIAEGVETEAQMSFLRAHQCDEIQGYYFAKPLPAEELASILRSKPVPAIAAHQCAR